MVPVAAVAETVHGSAALVSTDASEEEEPEKVAVPVKVGEASGATPVSVLVEYGIVLLLTVRVLVAVRTFDGVMMLDRLATAQLQH